MQKADRRHFGFHPRQAAKLSPRLRPNRVRQS